MLTTWKVNYQKVGVFETNHNRSIVIFVIRIVTTLMWYPTSGFKLLYRDHGVTERGRSVCPYLLQFIVFTSRSSFLLLITEEIMLSLELDIVMFIFYNYMATYKTEEYDKKKCH